MNAIMSKPSAVHYQEYPPLFKIDSKGSTRVWSVTASNDEIIVSHGLKDGAKIIDITKCSPKNVGRSNETTGEMQAVLESQALWIKKTVRDGYSDTVKEFDGFIQPMLARDYTKVAHQIKAKKLYVSAKLDGLRAIWIPSAQKFQSRKGTFYDMPHLEAIMKFVNVMIDGEIYCHEMMLNQIASCAKKNKAETAQLEFRAFDLIDCDAAYLVRYRELSNVVEQIDHPLIKIVDCIESTAEELGGHLNAYIEQGYEGLMIRQNEFKYEKGKRSLSLFKYKEFQDAEFKILDVKSDKEGGGILCCIGFDVRMRGSDGERRHQLDHKEEYIGKNVTVRFQNYSAFGIPIFPVGICMREDV